MNFSKNNQWRSYFLVLAICFCSNHLQANSANLVINKDSYHTPSSSIFSDTLPKKINKKNKGWEILFDGKNIDKWRAKNADSFPSSRWQIKDGSLSLNKKNKGAGDIITREVYSDFELVADFNLSNGANSGIKYFVAQIKNKKTGESTLNGPEYQVIDDYNHPEIKDHPNGTSSTAACYLLYEPTNKKLKPSGQWNHMKIIAKGKHVEHWLNGVEVVSYERGSDDFLKKKAATKFADYENYGEVESGHILLTDHGDEVAFKNIKIRRL